MAVNWPYGAAMKKARRRRGWSVERLARNTGLHGNTISGYETGLHQPGLENLIILADALDLSLDEYVGRDRTKHCGECARFLGGHERCKSCRIHPEIYTADSEACEDFTPKGRAQA